MDYEISETYTIGDRTLGFKICKCKKFAKNRIQKKTLKLCDLVGKQCVFVKGE
jgi:hypothetical protein